VTLKSSLEVTQGLKLVPFNSLSAVSYSLSVVTMSISCIVCEVYDLLGRKLRNFYTPPVFSAPTGVTPSEFGEDV